MFEFKSEDLAEARRIVSQLHLPSEFGTDDDLEVPDVQSQLEDIIDGDYFVSCGISKAVIIIDSLPFVIKIPFNGRWYSEWYDTDECNRYFIEFEKASDVEPSDYCYDELDRTKLIHNNGYGCFVPRMEYLTRVDGYNIYIQEKVTPRNEKKSEYKPSEGSLAKAREEGYWDLVWAATAIDLYGLKFFHDFMDWAYANCHDMMMDLHQANYGYRYSGEPVILDVSGFRD